MATLKSEKTKSNFLKKGFTLTNKDHKYLEFWFEDKLITRTMISHNGKDIDDYLIAAMQKQCKMGKSFFVDFAKCNKSKEDYINLLTQSGVI